MDPVLEGLVTTVNPDGTFHLATMGPRISSDCKRLLLRPYPTSQTLRNLKARREGVLHVTDDVLLITKAALGDVGGPLLPPHRRAESVHGFILSDACRFHEFVVRTVDETGERV